MLRKRAERRGIWFQLLLILLRRASLLGSGGGGDGRRGGGGGALLDRGWINVVGMKRNEIAEREEEGSEPIIEASVVAALQGIKKESGSVGLH